MSLKTLKKNVKDKAEIKEAYLDDLVDVNQSLSKSSETKLVTIAETLIDTLELGDNGLIKNSSENKQVAKGANILLEREFGRYRKGMNKALTAVGVSAVDVYQELKKVDTKYLGKDRYSDFILDDDTLKDVGEFHESALAKNKANIKRAEQYTKDAIRNAILFNLSIPILTSRLINDSGHLVVDRSSVYATGLNNINDFSGNLLNFYTEVPRTVEAGYREVFNSNPMDERTKPICASATMAGIISITEMAGTFGMPPRMLCRCDVVWVKPAWIDVKNDVKELVDEQRVQWRRTLISQPRRKDGKYYSTVNEQLKVLDKKLTPTKFKETALHTDKMRLFGRGEIDSLINEYGSTYNMQYSVSRPSIAP